MISTHTPLARRDYAWRKKDETIKISTHTPLARRDTGTVLPCHYSLTFLLTRLLRGATIKILELKPHIIISTHTPLARRDII